MRGRSSNQSSMICRVSPESRVPDEHPLREIKQLTDAALRCTVGADRAYDTRDFVAACREQGVTPHVAQNQNTRRRSALDDRTTRHVGYAISQRIRMRIQQVFGWTKVYGGIRKMRLRGVERTQTAAYLVGAAPRTT